jgi:hypothetical protein
MVRAPSAPAMPTVRAPLYMFLFLVVLDDAFIMGLINFKNQFCLLL